MDVPPNVSPTPQIPVCVSVEPCTLLDDSTCSTKGQTCTIVRNDGTTSCVDPGTGQAGDPCPCAAGHVCSYAVNQCLKLCRTSMAGDCPEGHMCAGGAGNYPEGFGSCVKL